MAFPVFVVAAAALAAGTMATVTLSGRRWWALSTALLGATGLLLIHGLGFFRFFADDAFITFRYSQNLADGLGPNWNSEGRVEGYTNFLWMLLLAGFAKAGFDLVDVARVLGFLAVVGSFLAVYGVWRLWSDEEPESGIESPVVLAAALLGLALVDGVAFWGFSGMETSLFMALLTGSAYFYLRERRHGGLPWSALALVATAMTRPEGLIAAAVTGAFVFAGALDREQRQRALLRALGWAGVFVGLYGSYFLWRYSYYDYLLPNTFYAKVGGTREILDRGLEYVWDYGLRYQLLALLAGTALLVTRPRIQRDALYVIALTGALLAGIVIEGGDSFPHGRFMAPLMPLPLLGGLAGFATVLRRLALPRVSTVLLVAAVLSLGALSLFRSSHELTAAIARERDAVEERELLGRWLSDNTPPDYTIAAFAVGAVAYYSERDTLDLLGVTDVEIAHTDVPNLGSGIAGHEKYNTDYTYDVARPEIIVPSDAEAGPVTKEQLRRAFTIPSSVKARDILLRDPRLWERYEVRSLNLDGPWFNFLQRKDTIDELEAPGLD